MSLTPILLMVLATAGEPPRCDVEKAIATAKLAASERSKEPLVAFSAFGPLDWTEWTAMRPQMKDEDFSEIREAVTREGKVFYIGVRSRDQPAMEEPTRTRSEPPDLGGVHVATLFTGFYYSAWISAKTCVLLLGIVQR
jgi:hypothetical protein